MHVGGCQNYDPFFDNYPKYSVPYYNRDPKRDHNFDNHPCMPYYNVVDSVSFSIIPINPPDCFRKPKP